MTFIKGKRSRRCNTDMYHCFRDVDRIKEIRTQKFLRV